MSISNTYINRIKIMHKETREAEVRIAKDIQTQWPSWTWTKCLVEARGIVERHGVNCTIVKTNDNTN